MMTIKEYVREILLSDTPEIPIELIDSFNWTKARLQIDEISVDIEMWKKHDVNETHQNRLQSVLHAMESGIILPPIIVMHHNFWLVDGYTRIRAALLKGVDEIDVITGLDTKVKSVYSVNEVKVKELR